MAAMMDYNGEHNSTATYTFIKSNSTTADVDIHIPTTTMLEGRINSIEIQMLRTQGDFVAQITTLNNKLDKAIEILKSQGINITELI